MRIPLCKDQIIIPSQDSLTSDGRQIEKCIITNDELPRYGGTSIVYDAVVYYRGRRDSEKCILKEFFPDKTGAKRIDKTAEIEGISSQEILNFLEQKKVNNTMRDVLQNTSDYFDRMESFEANGTAYILNENKCIGTVKNEIEKLTNRKNIVELIDEVIKIIRPIAKIHERKYIHADIKPANLMYTDAMVKALDFGSCICINEKDNTPLNFYSITKSEGYHPKEWAILYDKIIFGEISEKDLRDEVRKIGAYVDTYAVAIIFKILLFGEDYKSTWRESKLYSSLCFKKWKLNYTEELYIKYVFNVVNHTRNDKGEGINLWQFWVLILLFKRLLERKQHGDFVETDNDSIEKLFGEALSDTGAWDWKSDVIIKRFIDRYNLLLLRAKSEDYFLAESSNGYDGRFNRKHTPINGYSNGLPFYLPLSGSTHDIKKDEIVIGEIIEQIMSCEEKNVYVQGLGGSGKSMIAANLYWNYLNNEKYIPLYVDFGLAKQEFGKTTDVISKFVERNLSIRKVSGIIKLTQDEYSVVVLIDNMHKMDESMKANLYEEITALLKISTVRVISFGRGPCILEDNNKDYHYKRISIEGINRADFESEANIVLPPNPIFNFPLFACIYLELSIGGEIDKSKYQTDYTEASILYDYLIEFKGKALLEMQDFSDASTFRMADRIVKDILPDLAYRMLVRRQLIRRNDIQDACAKYELRIEDFNELVTNRMAILVNVNSIDVNKMYGDVAIAHDVFREFFCALFVCRKVQEVFNSENVFGELPFLSFFLWSDTHVRELTKEILAGKLLTIKDKNTGDNLSLYQMISKSKEFIINNRDKNRDLIDGLSANLLEIIGFDVRYETDLKPQLINKNADKNGCFIPPEYKDQITELLAEEQIDYSTNYILLKKAQLFNQINGNYGLASYYNHEALFFEDYTAQKTLQPNQEIELDYSKKVVVLASLIYLEEEYVLFRERLPNKRELSDNYGIMLIRKDINKVQRIKDPSMLMTLAARFEEIIPFLKHKNIDGLDIKNIYDNFFNVINTGIPNDIYTEDTKEPERKEYKCDDLFMGRELKRYDIITFDEQNKVVILAVLKYKGNEYVFVQEVLPDESDIVENYKIMQVRRYDGTFQKVSSPYKLAILCPKFERILKRTD